MSNWKKYGGINNLDNNNNVTVYSLVADSFTLRQAYYGTFDICGELFVSGNATVNSNLTANNINVVNDISTNSLHVNDISIHFGNVFLFDNLDVSGNIYLRQQLFLGNSMNAYLFGTDVVGNIGFNTKTPVAEVDISSSKPFAFNVGSAIHENINAVPLQNSNHRGILLNVTTNASQIEFYNDSSINYQGLNPNGKIKYSSGGELTIDVSKNTNIFSTFSVTNRDEYSHVMKETAVIYDISNGPYLKPVYENLTETTGNALSLIANDSSSNTFMNIVTPNKQGLSIGGGVYPNDQTRSMGTIGWSDSSANYTPSINIVSGNSKIRNKSTVGINTHAPYTESYVVDINGPIHLKNGELTISTQADMEIKYLTVGRTATNCALALGSPYTDSGANTFKYKQKIYYTSNSGETWKSNFDLSGESIEEEEDLFLRSAYIFDSSLSIIGGDKGTAFYSYGGFASNWNPIVVSIIPGSGDEYLKYSIKSIYINPLKRVFFGFDIDGSNSMVYWFDLSSNIYQDNNGIFTNSVLDGSFNLNFAGIKSIDGYENSVYVTGNTKIIKYSAIYTSTPVITTYTNTFGYNYNTIYVSNQNNIIAGGINIISYSTNGGTTWTDLSLNNTIINSISILDASNSIAVCNSGKILTSSNWQAGSSSWSIISNEILNVSGNSNRLNDPAYNLTNIAVVNSSNFYITKPIRNYVVNTTLGNTSIFHVYIPNFINNSTNYVFDISGSSRISGDMNVNDGGKIASNNQTFNLLNNGVNQIYFGGDASYVYVGSTKNSTLVAKYDLNVFHDSSLNGNIVVGGNALVEQKLGVLLDTSLNANLFVAVDSSLNGNIVVGGNALVNRKLGVLQDTSLNANLFVAVDSSLNGNIVVGGNALVNQKLGVLQDTSLNANLFVAVDSSLNGNLAVGGNALVNHRLGVLQDTSLNANLFVAVDSSLNGNLAVGGNALVNYRLGVLQDTSLNANLFVAVDSSLNGNLAVGGNALVNHRLGVLQDTSLNANLYVGLDSSLNGNLAVGGNAVVNYRLGVLQDTSLNRNLFVGLDSSLNGNLAVGGNAVVNYRLGVLQDTSLNANLFVGLDSSLNGNLVIGGNTTVNQQFNVLLDTSLNGNLIVGGNAVMNRRLGVLQDTSLNANLFVAVDSSLNGNLAIGGNAVVNRLFNVLLDSSLNGNLAIGGNALVNLKLGVLQDTSLNANLFVAVDSSLNGNLVIGGNAVVNRQFNVLLDSSLNGNLTIGGNAVMNRKLGVLQDTSLNANLFVAVDSSLNGNLVVGGNAVVNRLFNVLFDSSLNGNLTIGGNSVMNHKLGVLQDTSLNANLFVAVDSSLNGNLVVGGNAVVNRLFNVLLDTSLNGNLVIGGNAVVNSKLGVLQDTSLNANLFVAVDSSLNGNLVVGGNAVVNRKLGVLQDTSLNANLFVARDSSFNGNLVIGNNLLINKNVSIQLDVSANANIYGNQIIRTNYFESLGGTTTGGTSSIGSGPYDINIGGFNLSGISGRNIKLGNFNNSISTRNNVYVGGPQDQIIIQGEVIQEQSIKAGPKIFLNYLAGPSSSNGSGIYIGDDGVLDNGYIAISSDRQGYVLKATEPSKRNIVKFDVFNMTLANTQPTGLISITPSLVGSDSSYTLMSSPIDPSNIILGNKTLSSATQQVIDMSLSIMGSMSIGTMTLNPSYALTVSGSIYQPAGLVWQF